MLQNKDEVSAMKSLDVLLFSSFCGNILRSPGLEQAIYSNQAIASGVNPCHLYSDDLNTVRRVESFIGNKKDGFRWVLLVNHWQGEARFGLIRTGESSTTGLRNRFVFLIGS